jgi:ParB-like chromosome segregation protein Spo0J
VTIVIREEHDVTEGGCVNVPSMRAGPGEAIVSTLVVAAEAAEEDWLPIDVLVAGDSPRRDGVDSAHVARLAECGAELPPIVVHRQTMRVIDGMHRLHAAMRNGRELVQVTFFDGGDDEAFILAVELNIRHGLPLSLSDRKAAARRILLASPELSDRAIGSKTGLSDKTIAVIRKRSGADFPHPVTRRGRDGRIYPVARGDGRQRVARLLAERPGASLRDIASAAGVSPAMVSNVRRQLLPPVEQAAPAGEPDRQAVLEQLCSDPSVRDKEAGRELVRWLSRYAVGTADLPDLAGAIPSHRVPQVAALARQAASAWLTLARILETGLHQNSGRWRVPGLPEVIVQAAARFQAFRAGIHLNGLLGGV